MSEEVLASQLHEPHRGTGAVSLEMNGCFAHRKREKLSLLCKKEIRRKAEERAKTRRFY